MAATDRPHDCEAVTAMDRWDRVAVTVSLAYVVYLAGIGAGLLGDGIVGWRFWAATGAEIVNCAVWLVRTDRRVAGEVRRLRAWGERSRAARDR